MNCPACHNTLIPVTVSDIELDVCKGGCGGIWFDQHEFRKFDEPHEAPDIDLLTIPINPAIRVSQGEKRHCPRCSDTAMMKHYSSITHNVEIDTCPRCAGTWLDTGELNSIRTEFTSEAERQSAAESAFSQMFDAELESIAAKGEAKLAKSKRFARMFKFICPSYYIPGKQDGGAF